MKYKLYTRDADGELEEPGPGTEHWYTAASLKKAAEKSRASVKEWNTSLRPKELPREFIKVVSEKEWTLAHPEMFDATASEIVDYWFTHLQRQCEMYTTVVATVAEVMTVFKGESGRTADLAVDSLEKWLIARDCKPEAKMVRGTSGFGLDARFRELYDEFKRALTGRMTKSELRSMFGQEHRFMEKDTVC